MENERLQRLVNNQRGRFGLLVPVCAVWGLMALFIVGFFWLADERGSVGEQFYLIPWCILATLVLFSPSAYLLYKNKFDLFHPLVFGVWSYIFPAFVLGGVILSFGWSEPYYLTYVENPRYNLPLTLVYVMVGFVGMVVGFALPIGRFISKKLDSFTPSWEWKVDEIWIPGLLLLIAGIGVNILGFVQGLIGFQRVDEIGIFDGFLFFLVILLTEGSFLLWTGIFTTNKKTGLYYLVFIFLLALIPMRMALQGNRGSLLSMVIVIAAAFSYSGRRLKGKHTVIIGIIFVSAIFIGMIYGTAFRSIKGSESRISAGDYFGQVALTVDFLTTKDPGSIIEQSVVTLAERLDNLSALGVAVANYEKLAPYEAGFGIENNIVNDLYTSFIPRFMWSDKPQTSDARAYSDLYFNFSENSFAVTPFGDLLRNFGPIGVPLGMMIIGIYFRIIHSLFIATENRAMWKNAAYFILLTVVSYEGFYATIFPTFVRSVFVLAASLFLVNIIIRQVSAQFRKI